MKTKISIVLIIVSLLSACAKPLPDNRLDYVGLWRSKEMSLLILADGSVGYERLKGGVKTSVNGPLKEFVGDDFVVGVWRFTTTFKVTEPPHEVDGIWQMVVDDVRLVRIAE